MARICNTSNIRSTYFGGGRIYSVQYPDAQLENGMIGVVGNLVDGEKEIREFSKVTDINTPVELALISSPEVMYDERPSMRRLENFVIEAGATARAYSLSVGDEFEVSIDAIKTLTEVNAKDSIGKYAILENDSFMFAVQDNLGGEAFACRIEDIVQINRPLQVNGNLLLPAITKMARLKVVKYNLQ